MRKTDAMRKLAAAWRKHGQMGVAIVSTVGLCAALNVLDVGCPILFVTGVPCLGCGMTRALIALAQLKITAAFAYHPLVFCLPLLAVAVVCRKRIAPRLWRALWVAVLVAFLAVYVLRLLSGHDSVVHLAWEQGVLGRAWIFMRQALK